MTGFVENDRWDAGALTAMMRDRLPDTLPGWLATRRWFADKGREIARVEVEDALATRDGDGWVVLTVMRVHFRDGTEARYFLPLAVTGDEGQSIITISIGNGALGVMDASETAWFGGWFLDQLSERAIRHGSLPRVATGDARVAPTAGQAGATLASPASAAMPSADSEGVAPVDFGQWRFSADPSAGDLLDRARAFPATAMGAEQSNTSLRYGDALIVKLIRRLQPAPNPDEEMLRALTRAGFPNVPRYAGGASWRDEHGIEYEIALAQEFVPNDGDGWSWMLRRLEAIASGAIDLGADDMAAERLLGRRTAEMHIALSGVVGADFAPAKPDTATIAANMDRVRVAAEQATVLLEERRSNLPASVRAQMPEFERVLRDVVDRAEGFREEVDTYRIRVHGDYHLGQTLRTPEGDWIIVDFEGEPARPIAARRQKLSVLKDVAGLLRSFGYARGAAERASRVVGTEEAPRRLRQWERRARGACIDGYSDGIRKSRLALVPADEAAFRRALAAWELDKSLYEVAYEARNRPDWIDLPLRGLLPEPDDQAEGSAPGAPA